MQMTAADQRTYPRFSFYVRVNIPEVLHVPAIVNAMRTIGQLQRGALRRAVLWGHGPTIRITPLVGAFGAFSPGIGSNEIRISDALVREFEAGRGRRLARAGNVYLVGVTLLHELVHWGDDQDGVDRPGEEGEEFENLVYGRVVD